MKSGTKVVDRGWRRIVKEMRQVGSSYVTVGVHEGDDTSLALVASVNEFGSAPREHHTVNLATGSTEVSSVGGTPERSFLRSTMDERLNEIREVQSKAFREVILGKMTALDGLRVIGQWVEGAVKAKISSNIPPPNAPSTIAAKGSSVTLIDSGVLRESITHEVHDGTRREGE